METTVSPAIAAKSILTAFGGSVRFGHPLKVTRAGDLFLGAFLHDGRAVVTLHGSACGECSLSFDRLDGEAAANVLKILRRCLTPENIRICIGDIIHLNRTGEDPFYGVISDIEGVALQVDEKGVLMESVPLIVIFGTDDFDVVGHREFTSGVLEVDTHEETYQDLLKKVNEGVRPGWDCRRYRCPGGGSSLEGLIVNPPEGTVIEYHGIEGLVYRDADNRFRLYPVYARMDEQGAIRREEYRG